MIGQSQTTQRLDALVRRLHDLGIITPDQIEGARREQAKTQERFSAVLARLGIIRSADSGKQLAAQLGWMTQRLQSSHLDSVVRQRIPVEVCRVHRIVPIQDSPQGPMVLATDDPFTMFSLEWLQRLYGVEFEVLLVAESDLSALLASLDQHVPLAPVPTRTPAAPSLASPEGTSAADEEPVIRLVDSVFGEAVRLRASDIHLEPLADRLKVRYRIDGVLHDVNTPPKALQGPITSRIKIMAGLNIAEKRLPQDGRLQVVVDEKALDVRVSTLPALHGESIVMRLLDRSHTVHGLSELGMSPSDQQRWEELIHRPYGMILVTGPTGSGKTTTLYATLAALNRPDRKLITLEDPVEYQLPGVNQVHVKSAIGMSFVAGLRAMLRQAPDVIMVGEIRDQETAQIAIQAALTGHLVFSTLHTNDAPSAVTRLIDMGVAPFLVASTIQGVLAQRLVRRICASCQVRRPPIPEEQAFLGESVEGHATVVATAVGVSQVCEGRGCETCHHSGYVGRIGIYELLRLSDTLRQLVVSKSQASSLRQKAMQEGMRTLRDDGRVKVQEGLTTVTEVLRATPVEE